MNEHTFERLRKITRKEAQKSNHKVKLGAAIFKKNRIISLGYNSTKTHPKLIKYFIHASVHSECDAVLHCVNKEQLKGSEIFVWREDKQGNPVISKPCSMCTQILYEYGVKRAWWVTNVFPYWETDLIENMYNQIDRKECFETNCKKPKNPPEGKKKRNN